MHFLIEAEQETDGRWIAEIPQIPGAMALLYRSDGKAQASRLGDLPKANHEKAVMRTVGGCAAPLYVRTGVGR